MKKLVVALVLTVTTTLATPAYAIRAGSNPSPHLDGHNVRKYDGPQTENLCDDFGGVDIAQFTEEFACGGAQSGQWWTVVLREAGKQRELLVSNVCYYYCTSASNLVGVVQTYLHAVYGGPVCRSDPYGIDGIAGPNTANLITLFNAQYLGQPNNPVWGNDNWTFMAKQMAFVGHFSQNTVLVYGPTWSFYMLHLRYADDQDRDYIIDVPFDGLHGTQYNVLDGAYGPDC